MIKSLFKVDRRSELEKEIDAHILRLSKEIKSSDDVKRILELLKDKKEIQSRDAVFGFSRDAILKSTIYLLGLLLIMNHERMHVIATKAVGFAMKLR